MPLILCGRAADRPFRHNKLNINIFSEQELAFLIYNYPLLCAGDFLEDELFDWIETGLNRRGLAEKLRIMKRQKEGYESLLRCLLDECNYLDSKERERFAGKLVELRNLKSYELAREEGRILLKTGNYSAAYDRFNESIRLLETDFRRLKKQDDKELRILNETKAGLLCDLALVKLEMFDEKNALRLLNESSEICSNLRAERMKYLINSSGDLSDEEKLKLDNKKKEASSMAEQSKAYRQAAAIFDSDNEDAVFKNARKLASAWKKNLRKM